MQGGTRPGQGKAALGPQFRAQPGGDLAHFPAHMSRYQGLRLILHPPRPSQPCSPTLKNSAGGCYGLGPGQGRESWKQSLKPTLEALYAGKTWPPLGPWLEGEVHLRSPRLVTFTLELTKDPPRCHGNQG